MAILCLDLGLIVPLAVFTAVAALRGSAIGYMLCSTLVVKAVAMLVVICAMLIGAWKTEGRLETVPFILFAVTAVAAFSLGLRMYRSISPEGEDDHADLPA